MNVSVIKPHKPVMLNEVLKFLEPKDNEVYVDCTFGAGGYTTKILESANCKVIGLDRDTTVKKYADKIKEEFAKRFEFINCLFGDADKFLKEKVDGIILDLGVSSMQLDQTERGFSFNKDAALDMRMGSSELTAFDIVNSYSEKELADIIYKYGDEVKSRQIAKEVASLRKNKAIETTVELADIVRSVFPKKKYRIDPATKTFQAIRIFINNELGELEKVLEASKILLKKNGRLIVVSFHSLEDKIVKEFLKNESGAKEGKINKYKVQKKNYCFQILTKKIVEPTDLEVKENLRSRSAKLRAAIKT